MAPAFTIGKTAPPAPARGVQWQQLGRYVRLSVGDRREAVAELSQKGHSIREIAEITGASKSVVGRDVPNGTPVDAVAALAADGKIRAQISRDAKEAERKAAREHNKFGGPDAEVPYTSMRQMTGATERRREDRQSKQQQDFRRVLREAVTNLTAEGLSSREIGAILGVSNATVSRARYKCNAHQRRRPRSMSRRTPTTQAQKSTRPQHRQQ